MFARKNRSLMNPTLVMKVQEALEFDTGLQQAERNKKRLRKLRVKRVGLAAAIETFTSTPWAAHPQREALTIEEELREQEPIRIF